MASLIKEDGTLPDGPFVMVMMKGFIGKPVTCIAPFDPDKLFKHPQIVEIIHQATVDAVKEVLLAAMEGNIFLLKNKPEGDQ